MLWNMNNFFNNEENDFGNFSGLCYEVRFEWRERKSERDYF